MQGLKRESLSLAQVGRRVAVQPVPQELEDARARVDACQTGTDRLRAEYGRLCAGTRDLLSSLRSGVRVKPIPKRELSPTELLRLSF
jgi:hypothetical protein